MSACKSSNAGRVLFAGLAAIVGLTPALRAAEEPPADYQRSGVVDHLPIFHEAVKARLAFSLSWTTGSFPDFIAWRELAREKVRRSLLVAPPEAPWRMTVLAEQDRGTYVARQVVFNVTGHSRVLAFMTVPKGPGPFPAVLLLHDHGARFDIGKEKVIRPWNTSPEKIASAEEWVTANYGGRFVGDVLAERGYVCLATDALNWSDRGGGGYDGQQALAANLLHLGMSFAGVIAWEDLRVAAFLAEQPEVDPSRVAAMGLSMGAFRTWQLAALSPHISAGVAVCWMNTVTHLMTPGNNQTRGGSAYTMTHPGLLDELDYPDIASLACPKPMLFFNGLQDRLFPVEGVRAAYAKMRQVWDSQRAGDRLVTRLWDVPHTFNTDMQEVAFAWLDGVMADVRLLADEPTRQLRWRLQKNGHAAID